jgi:Kef-type K+ transport system membrane component KefB
MGAVSDQLVALLFIDLAVILVVARAGGSLAVRCGQPRVVGEIATGVALGPGLSVLPLGGAGALLFPPEIRPLLGVLAQLAVVLFVFRIGHELAPSAIREVRKSVVAVSAGSVAVPFAAGTCLALWLSPRHAVGLDGPRAVAFVLFIGASLTVTALPVLAEIIDSVGLRGTAPATVSLVAASTSDLCAWLVLAVVMALMSGGDVAGAVAVGGLLLVFLGVLCFGLPPAYRALADRTAAVAHGPPLMLAAVAAGLFASAAATTAIGLHAVLGAFAFGALLPRDAVRRAAPQLPATTGQLTALLLPVFFVVSGLSVALPLGLPGLVELLVVTGVACASKFLGGAGGASLGGMSGRQAVTVGVLMNTRGLTELILLGIGRASGVLDPALFAVLTVTTLVTTVLAGPLSRRLGRSERQLAAR